jgi:hypothetical protein
MAIAGGTGARVTLGDVPLEMATPGAGLERDLLVAFTETPGRFVCAVPPALAERFARRLEGVPWAWIGSVTAADGLEVVSSSGTAATVALERLAAAWRGGA